MQMGRNWQKQQLEPLQQWCLGLLFSHWAPHLSAWIMVQDWGHNDLSQTLSLVFSFVGKVAGNSSCHYKSIQCLIPLDSFTNLNKERWLLQRLPSATALLPTALLSYCLTHCSLPYRRCLAGDQAFPSRFPTPSVEPWYVQSWRWPTRCGSTPRCLQTLGLAAAHQYMSAGH